MLTQPGREFVEVPQFAERDAEFEEAQVMDREQRVRALIPVATNPSTA